ncbi:MAG: maleylpyruvate isomerase N-terminal domain-containing protein [Acidimicrobiia bacterium]|nr:maleylpyruvate isomerase N-terminal domain-containing protein [Acidimicrobiia bacterium]
MPTPTREIGCVADAHRRLLSVVDAMTDADMRRASLLPGWTVGHVLTHVARNADSHVRRTEAARRGEMADQYNGGYAGREAEIDTGAGRSAVEIVHDVRQTAHAVDEVWLTLPGEAWAGRTRDVSGRERPLFELPSRRWQEIEVHMVDLGAGVSHRDWPEEFVLQWLPRTRERMWPQLPVEAGEVRFEHPSDELAWLYGRLKGGGLPELPAWG